MKDIPTPTNVVKLAEAVSRIGNGVFQQLYYDAGAGSSNMCHPQPTYEVNRILLRLFEQAVM